ncbi:hypothetical protein J2Y58_003154 [Sphingomonas sp. BE138]|uniref:hypothetical protein n=1 Tax=Sphingomonas sp. BE138 TaxID=2817845 RepID=UPI00285AB24E|nr:hypothetical protein [Sphingomonas sp. BE138]MDR6789779.1 hypothetical protein [Sphingomonas sp. BE138]
MGKTMVAVLALLATGGCVRTAWNVATLPVKAVGKGADLMTTSAKERDEKYVRKMRKEQERRDKECRKNPETCESAGYLEDPRNQR